MMPFFFTAGRLKWTQRISSLQLPAGLTGRCSSRTPTCSACAWTQKRIPGSSLSLQRTPLYRKQQTNPHNLWKTKKRLLLQVFLCCCHHLLSLTLCCRIYFAPLFSCMAFCRSTNELCTLRRDCKLLYCGGSVTNTCVSCWLPVYGLVPPPIAVVPHYYYLIKIIVAPHQKVKTVNPQPPPLCVSDPFGVLILCKTRLLVLENCHLHDNASAVPSSKIVFFLKG